MHSRRIAAFLLGAWLAGSLLTVIACVSNLVSVDEALASPDSTTRQIVARAEHDGARMLLRSLAAVQDAHLLSGWELAQAPIGVLLLIALVVERPTRVLAVIPIVMLLLVGFEHVLVMPEIAWLGQAVAFLPDTAAADQHRRLDNMQHIYGFAEAVKLALALLLAVLLFVMRSGRRGSRPSSRARDPLDRRVMVQR